MRAKFAQVITVLPGHFEASLLAISTFVMAILIFEPGVFRLCRYNRDFVEIRVMRLVYALIDALIVEFNFINLT